MPKKRASHKNNAVAITSLIIGAVIFLTLLAVFVIIPNFSSANTVTVEGSSDIKVTPDQVAIYFNIQTNGTTSSAANDANTAIYNQLRSSLMGLGFDDSQIQTQSYSIYPNIIYDNTGKSTNYGYIVSLSLKLEFSASDTSKLSSAIDAGANAGVGIQTIDFELSTALQNQYKAQALQLASQDAKTKADAVAAGFGKTIGSLVSVTVNDFNYRPWPVYASSGSGIGVMAGAAAAKASVMNLVPSSRDVTADVSATYRLI